MNYYDRVRQAQEKITQMFNEGRSLQEIQDRILESFQFGTRWTEQFYQVLIRKAEHYQEIKKKSEMTK
jgi:hypothetical protein